MINFNQVSKQYQKGQDTLSQINFSMQQGEMVFLTGHSGAGKSTLLKLLALIEQPTQGSITVQGKNLAHIKRHERPLYRANLGIVFQSPQLLMDRSIFANVALPLSIQGLLTKNVTKRVHAALDRVGLLSSEHLLPEQLSGGEQQRVGLARAIVHKPLLLLADEPTGNLDPEMSRDVMSLFCDLNRLGMTILVATHDLPLIATMKHRMLMLKRGCIC
ncbi:MAG: cell division ATP-binding protein FtsE [Legionella sp.]|nr:MAG: cell division ATP-binding protein FtsE [Legionella sp.]